MNHSSNGLLATYGSLVARLALAALFLFSGMGKVFALSATAGYIATVLPMATILAVLAAVVEIAAAVMLIIGWKGRFAAWALIAYTALATVLFHLPNLPADTVMSLKNLSIMGGLLLVAVYGTGRLGVQCDCGVCPRCERKPRGAAQTPETPETY